jgi:TM2 domain-containing membrane protein YozV
MRLVSYAFAVILITFSAAYVEADDENLLSPENAQRFAQHLLREGEYLRAAVEFQRYLYSTETHPANLDSALFQIGLCYRLGGDLEKAILYFSKVPADSPRSLLIEESYYQVALCHLMAGRDSTAVSCASNHLGVLTNDRKRLRLRTVVGLSYLRSRRWEAALALSDSLNRTFPDDPLLTSMRAVAEEGQDLPRKNKYLAGLCSAVIPGAGRFYSGRPMDGVFSFLAVGLTSWQAYDAFDEYGSSSVKGWVYGSIASILYLGNIYGSAVAAQIYNEEQNSRLSDKVEALIDAQSH